LQTVSLGAATRQSHRKSAMRSSSNQLADQGFNEQMR
jgi:hypothetical protein